MGLYARSVVEVAGIAKDALCYVASDTRLYIGSLLARADEWLADYGNDDE